MITFFRILGVLTVIIAMTLLLVGFTSKTPLGYWLLAVGVALGGILFLAWGSK